MKDLSPSQASKNIIHSKILHFGCLMGPLQNLNKKICSGLVANYCITVVRSYWFHLILDEIH